MWEPIHVKVELFNSEVAVHYDALQNSDFQIGRAGWLMDYNDAINMLDLLRSDVLYNYGRYNNPEFDALLRQSATMTDQAARAEVLRQAEEIAMGDFAACRSTTMCPRTLLRRTSTASSTTPRTSTAPAGSRSTSSR